MSNAIMPLAHYKETCDVIREKTGSTDTIKSGEMPDKINDVFRAGQLDIVSSAEALKGSASGSSVAIKDISPVEHDIPCKVGSKNIFNGELTIWRNADRIMSKECIKIKRNTWYRITAYDYTIAEPTFACFGNNTGVIADGTDKSIVSNNFWNYYTGDYDYIWFRQWNSMTDAGITLDCRVQIEEVEGEKSPATDFTPYIEDFSRSTNKNLFDGILESGSISSTTGVTESTSTRLRSVNYIKVDEGEYTLSTDSNFLFFVFVYDTAGNYLVDERFTSWSSSNVMTFTSLGKRKIKISIKNKSDGTILPSDVPWVQMEKGSIATEYVPYNKNSRAVSVLRFGKNLCDIGTVTFTRGITIELPTPIPANTPFVFSGIFESDCPDTWNLIQFNHADGTTPTGNEASWSTRRPTERQQTTKTFKKAINSITFYAGTNWANSAGLTGTLTDVQVEIGSTATEYEPYIEPVEFNVDASGNAQGNTYLYPSMTLMTDTEGVNISAEYIKDIDKAFGILTTAIALSGGE